MPIGQSGHTVGLNVTLVIIARQRRFRTILQVDDMLLAHERRDGDILRAPIEEACLVGVHRQVRFGDELLHSLARGLLLCLQFDALALA